MDDMKGGAAAGMAGKSAMPGKAGMPMMDMPDKAMMGDMTKATSELEKAIAIHSGHMDGSVAESKASEKQEMDHMTSALAALQACMGKMGGDSEYDTAFKSASSMK